jgi:predicted nuclease of restriction endonuclease-like (RecB) superfamily
MDLLDKLDTTEALDRYAAAAISNGWSRADLQHAIDSRLLERRGLAAHNFPAAIPVASERELGDELVSNIVAFLQELGVGFAFVGRQYALHASRQPLAVSTYTALEPEMKAMLPEPRALSRIVDETIAEHSA